MAANAFHLVFDPGDEAEERIAFSICEADIEDAADYGRVERHESFDQQLSGAAYHMVLDLRVCKDDRIFDHPWVILRNNKIIGRNSLAMGITENDLA